MKPADADKFRYRIMRRASGVYLTRESGSINQPIDTYNHVRNHSPDGFEYGYGGSGPAQLALALLCYHTGDDRIALAYYQNFKAEVIARLDQETAVHTIQPGDIDAWLKNEMEKENYENHQPTE